MSNVISIFAHKAGFEYKPEEFGIGHVWKTRLRKTMWEVNQEKARKSANKQAKAGCRL